MYLFEELYNIKKRICTSWAVCTCMRVYMCTCMCVYIYVCGVCACVYACVYTCVCVRVCVMCLWVYLCVYVCLCICVCACVPVCICVHIHACPCSCSYRLWKDSQKQGDSSCFRWGQQTYGQSNKEETFFLPTGSHFLLCTFSPTDAFYLRDKRKKKMTVECATILGWGNGRKRSAQPGGPSVSSSPPCGEEFQGTTASRLQLHTPTTTTFHTLKTLSIFEQLQVDWKLGAITQSLSLPPSFPPPAHLSRDRSAFVPIKEPVLMHYY